MVWAIWLLLGNIQTWSYQMAQRKDAYNNKVYEIETRGLYAQTYTYDNLNRLKTANLDKNGSGVLAMTGSQSGIAYDANGNILSMQRTFKGQLVDDLTYNLPTTGNRLTSVQDNGNDTFVKSGTNSYTYDANGNLLTDSGKGVSNITYNYLNLPQQINTANGTLVYSYTATGQKLRMTVPPSGAEGAKTYDYVGSLVYENNVLAFIGTTEGRVLPPDKAVNPKPLPLTTVLQKNTFYRYEYQLKDHLGNLRLACRCAEKAFKTSPADTYPLIAVQENHYDAWGLSLPLVETTDKLSGSPEHRFKFLGREEQPETGWVDLMKRMYDPPTARFTSVDPSPDVEGQESLSTYQYGWNNPILRSDPNGDFPCCDGVVDFAKGAFHALMEDNIPIATNYINPNGSNTYQAGVKTGHVMAMLGGVAEIITGIGGDVVAVGGEVVTVGAATPVAVPLATGSTSMILHGGATFAKAAYNLNSHGNKLDDKPAEGYTLRDKKTKEVKKYGETTRGEDKFGEGKQKRYSKKELEEKGVDYKKETNGTKKEMHKWQNEKIKNHKENNKGKRPDLNKSDY